MSDIPQWAYHHADEEAQATGGPTFNYRRAFAQYISENEKPPVDPLLLEAREICASFRRKEGLASSAEKYHQGYWDQSDYLKMVLAALKSREAQS